MMRLEAVIALFPDLDARELSIWVERRWVQPEQALDDGLVFHDIDVARVRMIYDLRRTMEVSEETVPLVLSLLDQVYELRRSLKAVTRALDAQPADVRLAVLKAIQDAAPEP